MFLDNLKLITYFSQLAILLLLGCINRKPTLVSLVLFLCLFDLIGDVLKLARQFIWVKKCQPEIKLRITVILSQPIRIPYQIPEHYWFKPYPWNSVFVILAYNYVTCVNQSVPECTQKHIVVIIQVFVGVIGVR